MTHRDDDPTSGAPEKSPYETEETVHRYERQLGSKNFSLASEKF